MLTKDEYNELSEKAKGGFVLDDTTGEYIPVKDAKLKSTLNDLDAKFKKLEEESRRKDETLSEYEKRKQEELEAAKAEALEKAKSSGDVKGLEERLRQEMEDAKKQTAEQTRQQVLAEINQERAQEKSQSLAAQVGAELGVDSPSGEVIATLIAGRIGYDWENKKYLFSDENGSAISVDKAGFIERLKKESRLARLIKSDVVTHGGGNANGSNGGRAPGEERKLSKVAQGYLANLKN